MAMDSENRF